MLVTRVILLFLALSCLNSAGGAASFSDGESGKITGTIRCDGAGGSVAVWAVTSDCRISYRTTSFNLNQFTLDSIPPGTCRLVGYCDPAFALPTPEFRVEPGTTIHMDVLTHIQSNGSGEIAPGIAPFNGRIVDEKGRPIPGVVVNAGGVQVWPKEETVSGPDGRFGFCAARPGGLQLAITHPDYRPRNLKLSVGIFNYSSGQLEVKLRKR